MVMICPYCASEINEKKLEQEDGCCPECGAFVSAGNVINEEEEDNNRNDLSDDDLDEGFDDSFDDDRMERPRSDYEDSDDDYYSADEKYFDFDFDGLNGNDDDDDDF